MSDTELSVICRECGSEVSPYVTECPYCGSRVRKRAPELEHHDDHFEAKLPARRRLAARLPRLGAGSLPAGDGGAFAVAVHVLAAAVLMVVGVAAGFSLAGIGAVAGPLDGQWWRLVTAQFAYDNVGYLLAVAITLAIFAVGIERRIGAVSTLGLLILAGTAGAAGGYGAAEALGTDGPLIAGGNSVALAAVTAWLTLRRRRRRRRSDDQVDLIGVGVVACALLLLPLLESSADVFAGLAGAAFGALAGLSLSVLKRR